MTNPEQQTKHETDKKEGFYGALASFEGTPLEPLVRSSLEEAGIDPSTYDPVMLDHAEYMGFPATHTVKDKEDPNQSPILAAIEKSLETGEMTVGYVDDKSVKLPYWTMYPEDGSDPYKGNAHLTSKLTSIGMLELKDAKTDEVLAYFPQLSTDGGRQGHALISTKDVLIKDRVES